jgi:hypothetical protein
MLMYDFSITQEMAYSKSELTFYLTKPFLIKPVVMNCDYELTSMVSKSLIRRIVLLEAVLNAVLYLEQRFVVFS